MTDTLSRRARPGRIAIAALAVTAIIALIVGFARWSADAGLHTTPDPDAFGLVQQPTTGASTGPAGSDAIAWPAVGEAAVAVGDGPISASSTHALPMASVSKLVTALMVLEQRPLRPGQRGDVYTFSARWAHNYDEYVARGQSALKLPIGGTTTQYQLIQGMLIGSACNYADILVTTIWGSADAFALAARAFIAKNGLDGITMVEPTGFDARNTATPAALIALGRLALANPVIADIVKMRAVDLPGAGTVENTNELLGDAGVVGIKTGTLDGTNLLSAKDVTGPSGKTVRLYVVVMRQRDDDARFAASRALYAQLERQIRGS